MVIKRLLLSDTLKAVDRIKQVETEVKKKEDGIRLQIEEHEKEFARKKAEAEQAFQAQKEQSEKEVARLKDQVIEEAQTEGRRILEQARKDEADFRAQIERDMEEKAVEYGGQIFNLVFSERITEELNTQFVGELLDALEEVDSTSITIDANDVLFRCSHPMAADQKSRLEQLLDEKFDAKISIQEKVEPELIAGLVFKLGSLEIDGSLLNRYSEAVSEVKKSAHV